MGKKFMTKKFRELLFEHHSKPFSEQKEIFNQTIVDWMGTKHNQIDDILLIGATIK